MAGASLLQKWQMLQAIISAPDLSATAKVVAARILDYFHSQTGRCCPPYQALADGTGLKRRAIIYAVQELEKGRWITVDRVKGGASASVGRYATNAFRIDFSRAGSEASTVHGDAPSKVHGDARQRCTNMHPRRCTTMHRYKMTTVHEMGGNGARWCTLNGARWCTRIH